MLRSRPVRQRGRPVRDRRRHGAPTPAASVPLPWAGETAQQLEAADGPTLPRSVPVSLHIPALGVSSNLMRLGLARDGTMQVPPLFGQPSEAAGTSTPPPGAARAVGHRRAHRHLPGTVGVLPARCRPPRRGGRRRPGRRDHRDLPGHRRARVQQVQLPVPHRLRPDQRCGSAAHHLRRRFRPHSRPVSGQHRGLRVTGVRPGPAEPGRQEAGAHCSSPAPPARRRPRQGPRASGISAYAGPC